MSVWKWKEKFEKKVLEKWKSENLIFTFRISCFSLCVCKIKQQFLRWHLSYTAKCGCIHLQQYEYVHIILIFRLNPPILRTASLFQLWTSFHPPARLPALLSLSPHSPLTPPLHPITILLLKWQQWWCNNSVNDDNILSGGNSIWGALMAHSSYREGGVGGGGLMGKWPELQKDTDLFNYTRGERTARSTIHSTPSAITL